MATGSPMRSTASSMAINPGVRRVHTVPANFHGSSATPLMPAPDAVETLFQHPNVKIVQFTAVSRPNSSGGARSSEPASPGPASIPWRSASERTLANGPFQIYRVPSSGVSFINSGTFLRHVLPKTQCWCVDEISKFVLRVNRHGSFYRIELPYNTEDDRIRIQEFRKVLSEILLFERSPSPFLTGNVIAEEETPASPLRKTALRQPSQAKKWILNKVWEPEDQDYRAHLRRQSTDSGISRVRQAVHLHETRTPRSFGSPVSSRSVSAAPSEEEGESLTGSEPAEKGFKEQRGAVTGDDADPQAAVPHIHDTATENQTLRALTQSQPRPFTPPDVPKPDERFDSPLRDQETESIASSGNSFYSVDERMEETQTQEDGTSESTLDQVHALATLRATSGHRRDASDATIRAGPRQNNLEPDFFMSTAVNDSRAATPSVVQKADAEKDDETTGFDAIKELPTTANTLRLRRLAQRLSDSAYGRDENASLDELQDHSRMDDAVGTSTTTTVTTSATTRVPTKASSVACYTPPISPRTEALLSTVMQKAYALFIGPPAHLIATMLRIATRVCLGLPIFYDSEDIGPVGGASRRRGSNDSGASSDPGKVPGYWEETSVSSSDVAEDDENDTAEETRGRLEGYAHGDGNGKHGGDEVGTLKEWEKDDYGNPLHFVPRSSSSRASSLASSSSRISLLGLPTSSMGRRRRRSRMGSSASRGSSDGVGDSVRLSRSVSRSDSGTSPDRRRSTIRGEPRPSLVDSQEAADMSVD